MKEDSFAIGIIEIPQDEYINKTWLVQKLNEAVTEIKEKVPDQPDYAAIVETLAQTINKIQPADVVEVRHAKWVSSKQYNGNPECPVCFYVTDEKTNYCPHCGALMDKEGKYGRD